jgi:hypothetical protein
MALSYYFTENGGVDSVVVFDPNRQNPVLLADSSHPHFEAIRTGLQNGDDDVVALFDVGEGVARRFKQVTDRVSYDGKQVLWDGDPVHNVLSEQLQRALEHGESNYEALAKFWEKLESNPDENSREQAYEFLASHSFQITEDGDVVGYKGVTRRNDGSYVSGWSSRVPGVPSAYVDGEPVPPLSQVPNEVGTTVTMPRSEVHNDPYKHCSRGLHVSTYDYANGYNHGAVMEVHVNPRDIVSVPNDSSGQKVRVCRYKVAAISDGEHDGTPVKREAPQWAGDVGYRV